MTISITFNFEKHIWSSLQSCTQYSSYYNIFLFCLMTRTKNQFFTNKYFCLFLSKTCLANLSGSQWLFFIIDDNLIKNDQNASRNFVEWRLIGTFHATSYKSPKIIKTELKNYIEILMIRRPIKKTKYLFIFSTFFIILQYKFLHA